MLINLINLIISDIIATITAINKTQFLGWKEINNCFRHDAACGGKADGWGVRACAVALTVGKDLLAILISYISSINFIISSTSGNISRIVVGIS